MRNVTLSQLNGENAFVIMGTIASGLKQLERAVPELKAQGLVAGYREKAMSGDYANLCQVSEEYAIKYLQTTLKAREGDLTTADLDDEDDLS